MNPPESSAPAAPRADALARKGWLADHGCVLRTLAISGYRSLREVRLKLGGLTVVTGPNGAGKSNLYRALKLLQETALGGAVASLAREGGLGSVLWAGPEEFGPEIRRGERPVQGTVRNKPVTLRIGFASDELSYSIEFGVPASNSPTAFANDAEIKREMIWVGDEWRPGAALVDRRMGLTRARNDEGQWLTLSQATPLHDSMLLEADPRTAPAAVMLREQLRSWRFYDGFRSDPDAPARQVQIGTRTPILSNDGRDLAAALQTIRETEDAAALDQAVEDAFPGARLTVTRGAGARFGIELQQYGLLRPLSQAELSDGTLRYLLWIAVLLTPRPPALMVLNEPETSLHPDLFPALGRLILKARERGQVWVVTHSPLIRDMLERSAGVEPVGLEKQLGETHIAGQTLISRPGWTWPKR